MRVWLTTGIVLVAALGVAMAADDEETGIDVGARAPLFRLNDQHGKAVSLAKYGRDRWTIVAFYPKSATPG